jgi:hypothetical protein
MFKPLLGGIKRRGSSTFTITYFCYQDEISELKQKKKHWDIASLRASVWSGRLLFSQYFISVVFHLKIHLAVSAEI